MDNIYVNQLVIKSINHASSSISSSSNHLSLKRSKLNE